MPASAKSHLQVISHVHARSRDLFPLHTWPAFRTRRGEAHGDHEVPGAQSKPAQFFLTLAVMVVTTGFFIFGPCDLAHSRRSSMT